MKSVVLQAGVMVLCFSLCLTRDVTNGRLHLTPFVRNGSAQEARRRSEVISDVFQGITSHTGFLTVKEEYNSNLYFWFFPAENLAVTPWIIWLQGGPGTTSLVGLFELIGPWNIDNDKVTLRNITWTSDYSVLFLDNPVGAGFSFTEDDRGYADNADDVGEQMFEFLQQFLEIFPELRKAPLFVAGESYAGKFVPLLGIQIHRHLHKLHINLRGIIMGSVIDARSMMHFSELCGALGLMDESHICTLQALEQDIVRLIDNQRMLDAYNKYNETVEFIKKMSGVNVYNFNSDPISVAPPFEAYVTRPDVRKSIHVGNGNFNYNNQYVYKKMLADIMRTSKPFVEELLEHYGVMSYIGQLDVIMSYSISKHTYKELRWSGREKYRQAPRRHLRSSATGAVVAYKKSGGNFTDILIRRAGRMVLKDQPEVAKFVLDLFINEYK